MMADSRQLGAVLLVAGAGLAIWSIGDRDADDTHAVKDQIRVVQLDTGGSDVVIKTSDSGETSVRAKRSYWLRKTGEVYKVEGDKLVIKDNDCGWRCDVDFVVTVPKNTKVIGETGAGDLELNKVADVDVEAGSSDVKALGVTGKLAVRVGSGDIEIENNTGEIDVETRSGDVRGRRLDGGPVKAKTTSGDIELELDKPTSVTADGTSGDVTVTVPNDKYKVQADTRSGDRSVEVDNDAAATNSLDVRTTSGDVTVRYG